MADEISLTLALTATVNGVDLATKALTAQGIDVAGLRFVHNIQQIGTSEEALKLGELATLGVTWMRNLDTTNFLEVRSGTGASNDFYKFLPGEAWCWRWGSDVTAPYAIADTAACYLEYVIFEI